ncbi:WD40-repeat-containing domain protein [Melanogaster broomeanus]|nr:WD40-repeat-containing domain protein [Melanogaster broomeanus]
MTMLSDHDPYSTVLSLRHGHMNTVVCMAFLTSGKYLASRGDDSTLVIWDINKGTIASRWHMTGAMLSICWDTNSDARVFCGTQDGRALVLHDIMNKHLVDDVLTGLTASVYVIAVCATSGDVALSLGPEVHLVKAHSPSVYVTFKILPRPTVPREDPVDDARDNHIHATALQFLQGNRRIVVAYLNHGVICWDVKTDTQLWEIHQEDYYTSGHFALSPDRLRIVVSNLNHGIRLYHLGDSRPLSTIPVSVPADSNHILNVVFLGSSQVIASGSLVGEVKLWEANTGECLQTLHHNGNVPCSCLLCLISTFTSQESWSKPFV